MELVLTQLILLFPSLYADVFLSDNVFNVVSFKFVEDQGSEYVGGTIGVFLITSLTAVWVLRDK